MRSPAGTKEVVAIEDTPGMITPTLELIRGRLLT